MDDVALYLEHFGEPVTLAGASVRGVFDVASEVVADNGLVTLSPLLSVRFTDAPNAAVGQVVVRAGTSYTVRSVQRQVPDGAMLLLQLARA